MTLRKVEQIEDYDKPGNRKRIAKRDKKDKNYKAFKFIWSRIQPLLPIKNLLILPGDCILPLNSISMFSLIEDLYTKNSSTRSDDHLQLVLSRKIRPFRCFEQLFPLLNKLNSQFVPMLKQLITGDYKKYIEGKKLQRLSIPAETNVAVIKSSVDFDNALLNYLQQLPERFYRYQLRSSNEQQEMEMKKVGMSRDLIKLLEPESTDILFQSTPRIFKDVNNYLKYMFYNLISLVKGGSMEWVDIDLETSDEIVIQTRFKNVYFSTPYSTKLVTITLFDITKSVLDRVQEYRKQNLTTQSNVLVRVNQEAENFFNKFYTDKSHKIKQRCNFSQIGNNHSQ